MSPDIARGGEAKLPQAENQSSNATHCTNLKELGEDSVGSIGHKVMKIILMFLCVLYLTLDTFVSCCENMIDA